MALEAGFGPPTSGELGGEAAERDWRRRRVVVGGVAEATAGDAGFEAGDPATAPLTASTVPLLEPTLEDLVCLLRGAITSDV